MLLSMIAFVLLPAVAIIETVVVRFAKGAPLLGGATCLQMIGTAAFIAVLGSIRAFALRGQMIA